MIIDVLAACGIVLLVIVTICLGMIIIKSTIETLSGRNRK